MTKTSANPLDLSVLPSVDALLLLVEDLELPHALKRDEARKLISRLRDKLQQGQKLPAGDFHTMLRERLVAINDPLRKVINGTGVVIHTNLGRAPLSETLFSALELLRDGYVNLEVDLETGRRGNRQDHLRPWIRALTGAEDGILVNNNAAAVLLALNSLADRHEVVISRGQLVEIGGSFRIPEILKKAGAKLVEVGTTNRTHLKDYSAAITARTRLLLWVHASNYKISGFTKEVSLPELVELGRSHNIPVMADLGSGALVDIGRFGLQREPLVSEIMEAGVDIVTFSVDKLLGGPQGGIIAGRTTFLKRIEKNNLLRALRPDKSQIIMTLQALRSFGSHATALSSVPIYQDFQSDVAGLRMRAQTIISNVGNTKLQLEIMVSRAQVGSGASPAETLPSVAISVSHPNIKLNRLAARLRENDPAILGRVSEDHFLIDLKAVRAAEDILIARALTALSS